MPGLVLSRVVALAIAATALASVPLTGQSRTPDTQAPRRTAWGAPDLQGVWSSATITPLERPAGVERPFLTATEVERLERTAVAEATDEARGKTAEEDAARAYNDFWFDRGRKVTQTRRSSLIVDPENGRIPALTAKASAYVASPEGRRFAEKRAALTVGTLILDGPEDADLSTTTIRSSRPPTTSSSFTR
jgi:hypothetical protein